jgi:predicted nuclease of predicted toxin-antitoxin system
VGLLAKRALLDAASEKFDVFVTVDKNMRHQQSLKGKSLAVIILDVPNVEVETYARFTPAAVQAIREAKPDVFTVVLDPMM